ncbi:MAG: hypothetical protein R6X33_00970 [Candidatus Brocadiia bacterium]
MLRATCRILRSLLFAAFVFFVLAAGAHAAEAPPFAWVEGENPTSMNLADHWTGGDRPHLLSGGQWLAAHYQQEQLQDMPEGGYILEYELTVPEDGEYDAWARVGMEHLRAPFQWRIGDGEWHTAPADQITFNVMQLKRWNDVAWLDLGKVSLDEGETTLAVRYREKQEGRNDMWIALDCFAFVKGSWIPDGKLKPGETYSAEEDIEAGEKVYELPAPAGDARRTRVKLNGLWEVARYDQEDMDLNQWEPVRQLPDDRTLRWMGVEVPGSLWNTDETIFAHRVVYRTRVRVPAAHRGRGFKLHFSGTNWIASVFVNGRLAGTHKGVWIPWDLDVSDYVQPGETNEIAIAVKGPYYAIDDENDPELKSHGDVDRAHNWPRDNLDWTFFVAPIRPSTKGDGNGVDYGIVNPVSLVSVGDAYTEDIFVQPGLTRYGNDKELKLDVTVRNTAARERTFAVQCEAVYDRNNEVEKQFELAEITVAPGQARTLRLAEQWDDPKLWWPEPDPHLYRLRTTILENGEPLDVQEELFGYRYVQIKGRGIYINGVRRNFWNWVNVKGRPQTGEEWLDAFHQENNRFTRFSHNRKTRNFLPTREERLEFYDRNGIAGRLCSMIDGMWIQRSLGDRRRHPVTGEGLLIPNWPVWEGFQRHLEQLAKAYRNHPSVIFYQVENELVYITGMNIYGAYLDQLEDLMGHCIEGARSHDPTRPYSVGGAGDLDCQCEINCPHYPLGPYDWYPENAYTVERIKDKLRMYPAWENGKPWYVGESVYATALERGSYAIGDEAFRSAYDAARGKARFVRMLYEGYRWAGVAGFAPWCNLDGYEDGEKAFSDLTVIPRKRTNRLLAGTKNEIAVKVMNDTLHSDRITFEWSYEAGGEEIESYRDTFRVRQGFGEERTITIEAPETDRRLEGSLKLKVSQPDSDEVPAFEDTWSVPVLPRIDSVVVEGPVFLLDRSGNAETFLSNAGVDFRTLEELSELAGETGLLVVGNDTLTADEAYGRDLLKFAAGGGRVIVLEQENTVAGANLPSPLHTTSHYGGYAHPQALGTDVFEDLGGDDLIDWAGEHPTYKNVYEKPTAGGRSLVECGKLLPYSALVEMPAGTGVIVLCQLRVGAKLGTDPAAGVLLRNMMEHYGAYRPATGVAGVYAPEDRMLLDRVNASGSLAETVNSIEAALDLGAYQVAVIDATEANLATLNGLRDEAQAFQEAGGWILLHGLGPAGIEEFNEFLGTEHMVRPFRMERVTLERPGNELAATLGNRDLAMYSPKHLQHDKDWISWNVYGHVVDAHRDAAPFTQPPGAPEDIMVYEQTWNDHDPFNFVNDLLVSDHWRYIQQIWIDEEWESKDLTFQFRRPETISAVRIWNNATYSTIEDLSVIFDGDESDAVQVTLPDANQLTEVTLPEPRRVEQSITLRVESWRPHRPREGGYLVGVNNVEFVRAEAPDEAVCLDNVGGLVAYPRGQGGTFLCQLKFMKDEPNPVNDGKKQRILNVLLQNMGVGSRSSTVALPGVNVRYEPVSLLDHCTTYLRNREGKRGWFGLERLDMGNLQVGEQRFGDVLYGLVDYHTAPVADCIVLSRRGRVSDLPEKVEGIDVDARADMLFLLQAAHVRRPVGDDRDDLPEVMRYTVHYADGETAEFPVVLKKHVDHWLQADPKSLPGAMVATTVQVADVFDGMSERALRDRLALTGEAPIPDTDQVRAVLYSMQVDNPRPDVPIESIDVELGRRGNRYQGNVNVAVVAITLGQVAE